MHMTPINLSKLPSCVLNNNISPKARKYFYRFFNRRVLT